MSHGQLGSFRKVDHAVVDDDPFWSQVRRRHPDVDLVLLPAPAPSVEPAPVPVEQVRAAAGDAVRAWRTIRPLLAERGVTEAPSVRWSTDPDGDVLVIEKAVHGLGEEGGTQLLRELALTLGEEGWGLHATTREQRPLLRATAGPVDLEGEAGAGATVIGLATRGMPVDDAGRAVVRDEVRGAVASWA